MERTLDDSENRRISLPEGFLCADAILRLVQNVTNGLCVNEKIIARAVRDYLPFIATENLMMEGVRRGGDRQHLHEIVRKCSMDATAHMKTGEPFDLLAELAKHSEFGMTKAEMETVLEPARYVGRSAEQVEAFLKELTPLLNAVEAGTPDIAL